MASNTLRLEAYSANTLAGAVRMTTTDTMNVNPAIKKTSQLFSWHIVDGTSRSNDATNAPSFDAAVLNFPWDWGGYNGQIALANTAGGSSTRMQIRSATSVDNGTSANPRYTPSYGNWREVVTATKATQIGSNIIPVYVNSSGQVTQCSYTLNATTNAGTATYMAYYSGANAISSAPNLYISSNTLHSTYKSGTWVNSLTNAALSLDDAAGSYGGWICGPTKDGRIAISTYQSSDNYLYFGYGERGRTTNSFATSIRWDGPNNVLYGARSDWNWLRVINDSSNNSDDAMVYLQNQSDSDWSLKINCSGHNYGILVNTSDGAENAIQTNGVVRGWHIKATNGYLYSTANSNTVTIGSQNSSFTHIYNSANISFIFNNTVSTTTGNLGSASYPWNNLYIGKANGAGIYYVGSQATYRMIRFVDNTGDNYGNGISIGGGGLVVLGSGESADTILANKSLTAAGGTEDTYIGADGTIYFFPSNNSWDASAQISMTASRLWVGVNGNTTRENQIGVQGGAGQMYMWCHASTTGDKGILVPAHGSGSARAVFNVNTNNQISFADYYTGTQTKLAYSQSSLAGSAISYLACWNGYELRAISKGEVFNTVRDNGGDSRWAKLASHNNLTASGNEFTFAASGQSGSVWFNYRTAGGTNGNITEYVFGNGQTGRLASITSGTFNGNVSGSAGYTSNLLGVNTSNSPYGYTEGNIIRAVWNVHSDNRWYFRAGSYQCRVDYANSASSASSATSSTYLAIDNTASRASCLQFMQRSDGVDSPSATWYQILKMNHGTGDSYYKRTLAFEFWSHNIWTTYAAGNGSNAAWKRVWVEGNSITSAVWNDYAECRQSHCEEFGYVVYELGDDTVDKTTERLQHFAGITSDTWGFSQGETEKAKTPIAVAGRVLAYTYRPREEYKPGDCVCAAPGGTVDIMTREEVLQYPDRIVGTVSCVPQYEIWGGGDYDYRDPIHVNGRIWVKVR